MDQQYNINSTLKKISLINNIPINFSINNRRAIKFRCPTIKETLDDLDFNIFISVISLTADKVKEFKINLNFKAETSGDIIVGFIATGHYSDLLIKYFLRFIDNIEYKENYLYINNEKLLSYEIDYILKAILVSVGFLNYDDYFKKDKEKDNSNTLFAEIERKQKEAEEKIRNAKDKKAKNSKNNLDIEEIALSVCYEFHIKMEDIMNMTYFGLIWYFGYVAKVDAHKLNQLILSSGFSKQKTYSYWLTK